MRKLVLGLLVSLLPVLCRAKTEDSIRFEMIRETINFLAKDSQISKSRNFVVNCKNAAYECLESEISDRNFKGAQTLLDLVKKWDNKKEQNSSSDLSALKISIINDVIIRPNKRYREKMQQYRPYYARLDQLVAVAKVETTPAASLSPENNTTNSQVRKGKQTDTEGSKLKADSLNTATGSSTSGATNNIFTFIALLIAITSLVLSFLTYKSKRKLIGKDTTSGEAPDGGSTSTGTIEEIEKKLTDKINTLTGQLNALDKEVKEKDRSLRNQMAELSNQSKVILFESIDNNTKEAKHGRKTSQPDNVRAVTMYAKYSDIEAGGFSKSMLQETQNGERIFEINILNDEGTYSVSKDQKVQRYALQTFEYLKAVCNIKGTLQANHHIFTLKEGTLSQSADGNWMIVNKADIELK